MTTLADLVRAIKGPPTSVRIAGYMSPREIVLREWYDEDDWACAETVEEYGPPLPWHLYSKFSGEWQMRHPGSWLDDQLVSSLDDA